MAGTQLTPGNDTTELRIKKLEKTMTTNTESDTA